MASITIELPDEELALLKQMADDEDRPAAEVVRAAVLAYRSRVATARHSSLEGSVAVTGVSGRAIANENDPLTGFGEG